MKTKIPRKQKRKASIHRFEFKTPTAGPILDLAEDVAINQAIAKATTGDKR
jgi:hypothetical protein